MRRSMSLAALTALLAAGCAESEDSSGSGPEIVELSAQQVVVGETLAFYGKGFVHGDEGLTRLKLVGTFEPVNGTPREVDLQITPVFGQVESTKAATTEEPLEALIWSRVGPFANPFTGGADEGVFRGTVTPVVEHADGLVEEGKSKSVELGIGPSIIIETFRPLETECAAPALRALPGLFYELGVRTTGIRATRFVYQLQGINGADGVTTIEHDFGRGNPVAADVLGQDEPVLFNPIPEDQQYAVGIVRVIAYDDAGNSVETALPIGVHRPIEVRYSDVPELAERFAPVPVSGIIPGTLDNRACYQESTTETRQQSVSVTVSRSWTRAEGHSVSQNTQEGISEGESHSTSLGTSDTESESTQESYGVTYGQSEANNVNYASSDGESWSWDMREGESSDEYASRMSQQFVEGSVQGSVSVSGEGSIPGFAKVSGSVEEKVGVRVGVQTGETTGGRRGTSTSQGYSAGGSTNESRSYGSTVTDSQSDTISGAYSLSTQRTQSQSDTDTRSQSRTWNLSEGVSAEECVSEGLSEAESQTWSTSESITTSQSLCGSIPATKVGIFYRQTTRTITRAEVRSYDLCGLATHMGELQFNSWQWAPELAIGPKGTDELPPSQFPSARCFIPPCGG